MKSILLGILLLFAFTISAQQDELVKQNKLKIEELKERLNQIDSEPNSERDSLLQVISDLRQHLIVVQNELIQSQREVSNLKDNLNTNKKIVEPSNRDLNTNVTPINSEMYYVVIKSYRNKKLAERATKVLSKQFEVKMVQNNNKSWYHVIEINGYTMSAAKLKAAEYHKLGREEVWWSTGKKFIL